MKYLLTTFTALVISIGVSAQDAGSVLTSISIGGNFPLGDYSSTDPDNLSAGYARTGGILNIMAAYKLNSALGLGATFVGHVNWVDNAAYEENFREQYPQLDDWSTNAQRWGAGGLMGGAILTFPFSGSIDLYFKAFAGAMLVYTPEVEIIGFVGEKKQFLSLYEQHKTAAFAFNVGGGLAFAAGERQYILVTGDYIYTRPAFDDYSSFIQEDPKEPPIEVVREYRPVVQTFSVSVGIGYYL